MVANPIDTITGRNARDRVSAEGGHLVGGTALKYRKEFNDFSGWTKSESGITIPAPAASAIAVNMGTTAGATGSMLSDIVMDAPIKLGVGIQLSQKIANNEVYIELVGCDINGVLNESIVAAWSIKGSDSTNSALARSQVRNGGAARTESANIATAPQTGAMAIFEITLESDEVWLSSKPANSAAARTVGTVWNSVSPDPNSYFRIRVRFVNGATAPASATTVTVSFVTAADYTELQAEVTGGNGNSSPGQSIPASVVNTPNVAVTNNPTVQVSNTANFVANASVNANGTSASKINTAATTNAAPIRGGAARLYGWQFGNSSTGWRYVKIYNKPSAPTVGTDVPVLVIPVGPGMSAHASPSIPVTFSAGLAVAVTAGSADTDTTATAAGDIVGFFLFA